MVRQPSSVASSKQMAPNCDGWGLMAGERGPVVYTTKAEPVIRWRRVVERLSDAWI